MPKVCLTAAQKERARFEAKSRAMADGLAAFKNKEKLSNDQIGHEIGLSHVTVAKLLDGENVRIPVYTMWKLLALSGIQVKRKQPFQDSESGE